MLKNAGTTLLLLGTIAVTMLIGVSTLANLTGLKKLIDEGHSHYTLDGQRVEVHERKCQINGGSDLVS